MTVTVTVSVSVAAVESSPPFESHAQKMPESERCFVDIPTKCHVNRHVHYWNDRAECFVSPLRKIHGLAADHAHRKFVVFQPDLGGWNNIRMALEVVILFAKVTGRILVLPPSAILYLLNRKKKWGENKSGMEDYFDFDRLTLKDGLETMSMPEFLETIAKPGLLSKPLPNGDVNLMRAPLYEYLESACYVKTWSPGMTYVGFNIPSDNARCQTAEDMFTHCIGDFNHTRPDRITEFSLGKRTLTPYDAEFHSQRAIYFPGHEKNRLLTHFYSYLFFGTEAQDHAAKRFMRDRLRYHDEIFCVGSELVERLLDLQVTSRDDPQAKIPIAERAPKYVAFHIRRGDFQQKHTRLPAEQIVELTNHLVPDRKNRIAYIATDEGNRTFFEPFVREYKTVYFLDDIKNGTGLDTINPNYVGMIEQVICTGADVFIGTPLSTFTAYITRMRGFLNRTITIHHDDTDASSQVYHLDRRGVYEKTFYFMKHHMYQLHTKPKIHFPLWIRDFVDVFKDIDDGLDFREFND